MGSIPDSKLESFSGPSLTGAKSPEIQNTKMGIRKMEKIVAVIIGKSRDLEHILFEGGWNSNQVRDPSFY